MAYKASLFSVLAISKLVQGANHDIQVGPGLTYSPNITTAAVGDTVTFKFFPGTHDVAQGEFDSPCDSLDDGFYSGFIVPTSGEADETFVVTINNTDPIWYYCSKTQHCQRGMAAVINPPSSGNTLTQYLAAAAGTSGSTTPEAVAGGVFAANSGSSTDSPTESPSGTPTGSGTEAPSGSPTANAGAALSSKKGVLYSLGASAAILAYSYGLI